MKHFKILSFFCWIVIVAFSGCKSSRNAKVMTIRLEEGAAAGQEIRDFSENINTDLDNITDAAGSLIRRKMEHQKNELKSVLSSFAKIESVYHDEALCITFDSDMLFTKNSNVIDPASKSVLHILAKNLNQNPDTEIRITGFTDDTGSARYNQTLSQKRAQSIYNYLTEDLGVNNQRILYGGQGQNNTVDSNATGQGRALNRRLEILILPNQSMIQSANNDTLN